MKASMRDHPYLQRTLSIAGVSIKSIDRIRWRKYRLLDEQREIEQYVKDIPDAYMRSIIELRYIRGLSWPRVGKKMKICAPIDGIRKATERYISTGCRS